MPSEHLLLDCAATNMNTSIDAEQIAFLVEDTAQDAKHARYLGLFQCCGQHRAQRQRLCGQSGLGQSALAIENASLNLAGPILDDEKLGEYYANAMEGWTADVGEPFLQKTRGAAAKARPSGVRRAKYPLAKMTHSKATIDSAQNSAKMEMKSTAII